MRHLLQKGEAVKVANKGTWRIRWRMKRTRMRVTG
jgi:hypothetical protein